MSILDFYSKFTLGHDDNALLGSLRRLLAIEEPTEVGGGSGGPMTDWGVWNQTAADGEALVVA